MNILRLLSLAGILFSCAPALAQQPGPPAATFKQVAPDLYFLVDVISSNSASWSPTTAFWSSTRASTRAMVRT